MRNRSAARKLPALLLAFALSGAFAQSLPEKQSVVTPPPPGPMRAYVSDIAFFHMVDGRLHVVDVEQAKYIGQIPIAFAGQATQSPDGKEIYVATTYYPRLSRGTRTDVVDIWDAQTLSFVSEIPIPDRRAQALNYRGMISVSPDSRWLFIQNATPASSISVVDLKARQMASEIATPGCWLAIPVPGRADRFATICGDGTMETITLDERGALKTRARSEPFFDADIDPIFVHGEAVGTRFHFVSFLGEVHEVDLGGDAARSVGRWSLLDDEDRRQNWRPGGYQLTALHAASKRLYVLMHPDGEEGSHKTPAAEIWGYDLETHKRVLRMPGETAISMTTIQGGSPRLVLLDGETSGLVLVDVAGDKAKIIQRMDGVAETPTLVEMHQ